MKLVLEESTKRFGDLVAVDNLNLDIEDGEIVSLLGPSGSGKTTVLNMISGFERPNHGNVYFGGKSVNDIHPRERNVGMVFQEYAIFTTMNAYENIAFGLRVRKIPKRQIER
ncbi:MAG TPA: ATP-binding cassette domain-containing protein [Spirochaetes bacterium]|nr:ATP-binding cassette domain-containing protein [Spirochaetota bacterium]